MHSSNAVVTKLRPRSSSFLIPAFLLPYRQSSQSTRRQISNTSSLDNISTPSASQTEQLRTAFASALINAGGCHHEFRRKRRLLLRDYRSQTNHALQKASHKRGVEVSKDRKTEIYTRGEYLALLDYYNEPIGEVKGRHDHEDTQDHTISWSEGQIPYEFHEDEIGGLSVDNTLNQLDELLYNDSSDPDTVFKVYKKLPEPGVKYLCKEQRIYLIRRLSVMEEKTSARTLAYLSLLDDYKKVGLPIPRHAWNSAISLGSTTLKKITDVEVEFALRTWKEMELDAGLYGNEVTFNILFDVASKAGKFGLAEMILREMDARGLKFTRFTRVGMILYHGLRGDGDQVRQAYRDFVMAREIIDTTVLNCVISALLAAGEPDAAKAVFERMKSMSQERESAAYAPKLWKKRRELGSILKWIARQVQEEQKDGKTSSSSPSNKAFETLQDAISISPDGRTYNILMRHYCSAGHLQRIMTLLREMHDMRVAPNQQLFRDLFMGFAIHGGVKYSAWTPGRLDDVWRACKKMLRSGDLKLGNDCNLLVVWALTATRRCIGDRAAMPVFEELQCRWQGDDNFQDLFRRPHDREHDKNQRGKYDIPTEFAEIAADEERANDLKSTLDQTSM